MPKLSGVTEDEIAFAVVQIAAMRSDGIATFDRIRNEIPKLVKLRTDDTAQSLTRPNEAMWEQKVRNIKSHYKSEGNFIHDGYLTHVPRIGYRVTPRGLKLAHRRAA
jgi:hypothetical protein